ncbi:MAG: hypothetical protein H7Z43_11855 [Clostridia bacterium]|nr:hypothetical protein [Deltaproteobacteria bacterium]
MPQGNPLGIAIVIGVGAFGFIATAMALGVWSVNRTGQDITPFLSATGHVLNIKALKAQDI